MLERKLEFDYPVVDLDLHIFEDPRVFSDYLEPQFRERAQAAFPVEDAGLGNLVKGKMAGAGYGYRMFTDTADAFQLNQNDPDYRFPGERDPYVRLTCMDAEGIDAGIVRNTNMAGLVQLPASDNDLKAAAFRAYNNWINDFCSADRNRLYPEALLPCFDMPAALKEMERCLKMGFKSAVVPGSTAPGVPLSDPYWDPLFSRMEEAGWPLFIHPIFNPKTDSAAQFLLSPNKLSSYSAGAFMLCFNHLNFYLDNVVTLTEITLGGMLDKHPKLNTIFIESGSFGFGELLYRLDKGFESPFAGSPKVFRNRYGSHLEMRAKTKPSELFERQIYVMWEGGDRTSTREFVHRYYKNMVWCSDIPHFDADGPWEGAGALRALGVDKNVERAIMGETGARLLHIPYEKRVGSSKNARPIPVAA